MKHQFKWREISILDFRLGKLPTVPGVYAIYLDGGLSYIGSASNLKARIPSHGIKRVPEADGKIPCRWGQFKSVRLKIRPTKKLGHNLMVECRLINRLNPRFNFPAGILPERAYA